MHLYYIYGSGVISCVKELPSQNLTFHGQFWLLSFSKTLNHNPRSKNGGFHLSEIQANYNRWLHGCLDLHYYTDARTYLGYPFLNRWGWLTMLHSLLWGNLGLNSSFQNKVGSASWRMHFGIHHLERAKDWRHSSSSSQNKSLFQIPFPNNYQKWTLFD